MLNNARVTSVLPVSNLEACKTFYKEKLGLQTKETLPTGDIVMSAGTSQILLRPMKNAVPSGLTEITFHVNDIDKEISDLESKGVKFEDYNEPEYKTDKHHIHTDGSMKSAWFKDPAGNVLCLHQYGKA